MAEAVVPTDHTPNDVRTDQAHKTDDTQESDRNGGDE
jgi:hypothetical protein